MENLHVREPRPRPRRSTWVGAALALGLAACTYAPLIPLAPTENGVTTVRRAGIELSAEVRAGGHELPEDVMPIAIAIANFADTDVFVGLDDVELVLDGELAEPALAPDNIEPQRSLELGMDPLSPNAAPDDRASSLAPNELVEAAFTGGMIESGRAARGIVYFPRPKGDVSEALLRVRVRPGAGSAPIQMLEIPYTVSG